MVSWHEKNIDNQIKEGGKENGNRATRTNGS